MKYLSIILMLFAFVFTSVNLEAQQIYQEFAADTVKGDTLTTNSVADVKWNGFITWDYTYAGYSAGDTAYVDFQGSNDDWTTYQTISTTTLIHGTTAANQHLVDNPAEYMNYRLVKRAYAVADTVIFTNKLYIYKR